METSFISPLPPVSNEREGGLWVKKEEGMQPIYTPVLPENGAGTGAPECPWQLL